MPCITAVLVLYRTSLDGSACFRSLRSVQADCDHTRDLVLLVYDNSPEAGEPASFTSYIIYRHDPTNGGVAAAYNAGLDQARANGSEWLLLLDQDTVLTREYMEELRDCTGRVPSEVAAIVPRLTEAGVTHSPQTLPRLSHRPLPEQWNGLLPQTVSAFNSGAALRVSALQCFPERYWLDFLDHAVFHKLQASGGKLWLMRARLEHRLSTQRLGQDASPQRYLNVLQAERDYYREYGSVGSRFFYHLRRSKQAVGQFIKVTDKRFALLSARAAMGLLPPTQPRTGSKLD